MGQPAGDVGIFGGPMGTEHKANAVFQAWRDFTGIEDDAELASWLERNTYRGPEIVVHCGVNGCQECKDGIWAEF